MVDVALERGIERYTGVTLRKNPLGVYVDAVDWSRGTRSSRAVGSDTSACCHTACPGRLAARLTPRSQSRCSHTVRPGVTPMKFILAASALAIIATSAEAQTTTSQSAPGAIAVAKAPPAPKQQTRRTIARKRVNPMVARVAAARRARFLRSSRAWSRSRAWRPTTLASSFATGVPAHRSSVHWRRPQSRKPQDGFILKDMDRGRSPWTASPSSRGSNGPSSSCGGWMRVIRLPTEKPFMSACRVRRRCFSFAEPSRPAAVRSVPS